MKALLSIFVILTLSTATGFAADALQTQPQKVGYAIGMNIGLSMKMQQLEVDPDQVSAGLLAAFKGEETLLTEAEMGQILTAFQQQMEIRDMEKMIAEAENNARQSAEYLARNSKAEGVVTLASGLQYKVISSGKGATPKHDSTVDVQYRGRLIDGTEFDSSYSRGEPATFPVANVISGWTEALQLMKEGDKWELTIPAALAYGERGAAPVIPPNATLVFEVELLKVH